MCGIVGFTGEHQAAPILLDGLSKLEYRGYDSAGLAVRDGENLAQVVKAKGRLCRVFGDGVQYEWRENDDKVMIPDVSIICNLRDRKNISFTGIPRFVMEVLSNATEKYDRHEKMNIYCKVGVSEYWIVDWRKKSVEIYLFDFEEDGTGYPYLYKTVTAQNKEELQLVMFPNLKITFEELFDLGEY